MGSMQKSVEFDVHVGIPLHTPRSLTRKSGLADCDARTILQLCQLFVFRLSDLIIAGIFVGVVQRWILIIILRTRQASLH
jgi:hypothetical protein